MKRIGQSRQGAFGSAGFGSAAAPTTGNRSGETLNTLFRQADKSGKRRTVTGTQLLESLPFIPMIGGRKTLSKIDLVIITAAQIMLNMLEFFTVLLACHIGLPAAGQGEG